MNHKLLHCQAIVLRSARRLPLATLLFLLVGGCGMLRPGQASFEAQLERGNYQQALAIAESRRAKQDDNALLWSLQEGLAARRSGEYQTSNNSFTTAEELIKTSAGRSWVASGLGTAASLLLNDTALPYMATEYDGIMVNTYKALNYLALAAYDDARVEFNRALDRQRRAKEHFAALIADRRQAIAAQEQREAGKRADRRVDVARTVNNRTIDDLIARRYSNFTAFGVYPDFINPCATYLAALFFSLNGDAPKAASIMEEAAAMLPDNRFVQEDFRNLEHALDTGEAMPPAVWVVFENGRGPHKEELRVDLPLYLVSRKVLYAGLAVPQLRQGTAAFSHLEVSADGKEWDTELLASMDRVVQTEFKDLFPAIVTRNIISAIMKTSLQYEAGEKLGTFGLLAGAVLERATTDADLRIWSALPKEFQLSRLPLPTNRHLVISAPGLAPLAVTLPPCRYAIVYVTIRSRANTPLVSVIPLQPPST